MNSKKLKKLKVFEEIQKNKKKCSKKKKIRVFEEFKKIKNK